MKKVIWVIALLVVAGLMALPAAAGELRVTGFFDNILPHADGNMSTVENDMTRSGDNTTFGRERIRFFFNFIASDDLRGIFAIEIDQSYGAPSRDRFGSGCQNELGAAVTPECGFRNAIDNNSIELKHLYADFRIPQIPIGNRFHIGGIPADVTPLHPHLIYTMDSGGLDIRLDFSPEVSLLLHYIQLEEDLERFPGSTKIGEDYITGGTLMLKPLPGFDLHLLGIFANLQAPFGGALTAGGGPFNNVLRDSTNVSNEARYYIGFDSRYRWGNWSLEPTLIYLGGTRSFTAASQLTTGDQDVNFNAFRAHLVAQYTWGKWLWAGRFAYLSGNEADDDINNQGKTFQGTFQPIRKEDVRGFRTLGIDGFDRSGEWFEILGRQEADATGTASPFGYGEQPGLDRFGKVVLGAKTEYKATDKLVLEGSLGAFWTAEDTGCPAVARTSATVCDPTAVTIVGVAPATSGVNFTGRSNYVGTEVDIGTRYTIMPGLLWQWRFGYAFIGDAFSSNSRSAQDAWIFINRVLYTF